MQGKRYENPGMTMKNIEGVFFGSLISPYCISALTSWPGHSARVSFHAEARKKQFTSNLDFCEFSNESR